jgi:septum formation protein
MVSGVDEDAVSGPPGELALVLAEHKAHAVAERLALEGSERRTLVLGCDSVLEIDGVAFGKPATAADAIARWKGMRGRTGELHTGHCLVLLDAEAGAHTSLSRLASATVHFGEPSDHEIAAYVATGEPLLVAGGFTLDRLGGWFVDSIEGDPGTVLGLSLPLLRSLLAELNVSVPSLWSGAADASPRPIP